MSAKAVGRQLIERWRRSRRRRRALRNQSLVNRADRGEIARGGSGRSVETHEPRR